MVFRHKKKSGLRLLPLETLHKHLQSARIGTSPLKLIGESSKEDIPSVWSHNAQSRFVNRKRSTIDEDLRWFGRVPRPKDPVLSHGSHLQKMGGTTGEGGTEQKADSGD